MDRKLTAERHKMQDYPVPKWRQKMLDAQARRKQQETKMLTTKAEVVDLIRKVIDDGDEVCIYRGDDLRKGQWPTTGVSPVYIGRIYNSAIFELEDRSGGNPLTHGEVHVIPNKDGHPIPAHVTTQEDIHEFDFR
jgi:hypothetical protein